MGNLAVLLHLNLEDFERSNIRLATAVFIKRILTTW